MIYVTGDTHIPVDIHKLNTQRFEGQKSMTKDDYLIICGDFGLLFNYRETGNGVPSCPDDLCWIFSSLCQFYDAAGTSQVPCAASAITGMTILTRVLLRRFFFRPSSNLSKST